MSMLKDRRKNINQKVVVAVSGGFDKHKKLAELDQQAELLLAKNIVMFDLDGTLTESKANLDQEMAKILCKLLEKKIVAVMGGGNYPQFQKQFFSRLKCSPKQFKNLFLLPTSGGRFYKREGGKWRLIYKNAFTAGEKKLIFDAFKKSFVDIGYVPPRKTYGKIIEDRESQITFSALGQKAPLVKKEEWNKERDVRSKLKNSLEKYLPDFEIRFGGLTSLDVTKKGIDKAYGVKKFAKLLNVPVKKMVYIGDALFKGGNDSAVIPTGIDTIQISGPSDVKYLLNKFLKK